MSSLSRPHWLDAPPVKLNFDPPPPPRPEMSEEVRKALEEFHRERSARAPAQPPAPPDRDAPRAAPAAPAAIDVTPGSAPPPIAPAEAAPDAHGPDFDPADDDDYDDAADDPPPPRSLAFLACDMLGLHYFCARAACRRAGACRGQPPKCLGTLGVIAPEPVRAWVISMLAARHQDIPFDEALAEAAEHQVAYECWIAGLEARDTRRLPREPPAAETEAGADVDDGLCDMAMAADGEFLPTS
jgi:hypothetical protein